jgi:N6-adenosine-specific RNA methylase IME4
MDAWGFTYKTNAFTWVKTNKKAASLFWGMGFWTRSNAELCLLGVKGKPKRIAANVHSVIQSPIEAHSRKPSCTLDRIVTLMGDRPRLEMFARGDRCDGWDRFGNEP